MAVDLLAKMKEFWSSDAIQHLSVMLDEQPDRITQALSLGAPTILGGLLKAATGPTGAGRLVDLVKQEPEEMAKFGGLSGLLTHLAGLGDVIGLDPLVQSGRSTLRSIFGDKLEQVLGLIASDSGARPTTAAALMSLLAPTIMGMIRKEAASHGLTGEGLRDFLMSQRAAIAASVPGNLAETLGVRGFADLGTTPQPAPVKQATAAAPALKVQYSSPVESKSSPASWWAIPAVLGLVALAAGYYVFPLTHPTAATDDQVETAEPNQPVTTAKTDEAVLPTPRADVTAPAMTADGRPVVETGSRRISMALPGDASLEVPEGSYLEAVIKMLRDDSARTAQTFAAPGLAFNQDSTLTTESAQSAEHLATIARAYPKAKIKIEARTAPGGPDDQAQRRATAQKRADSVRDVLVQAGVSADRVTAEVQAEDASDAPAPAETEKPDVSIMITPQ